MAISLNNNDVRYRVAGGRARAAAWLKDVARTEGLSAGDIAVVFCSDAALLEINRRYLGHDYFTDVITFDYRDDSPEGTISGDIYVSVDTVARNAAEYGADEAREMLRVMAHGVLHLCGYGDSTDAERETMRLREEKALALYDRA